MSDKSFAHSLGRGIGATAAYAGHCAAVSFTATGNFGKELVEGTGEGFTEHKARLAAVRAAARVAREEQPIAMQVVDRVAA